jgi:L-ascorbate metabolism protein UlaG (beta-lactamase superfamily)
VSDHFDGKRFHNLEAGVQQDGSFLKWMLNRERGTWNWTPDAPFGPPPPQRVGDGRLHVTFINHATTLIQLDGLNILTDPVWSERVSPVYDHLDLATLRRLCATQIITPIGNARVMRLLNVKELDWWESDGPITVVPARHFSSRGLKDRNRNLWGGFVIASPSGNVYFAGDTGWGHHFEEIGRRFAPIRLALLPIGAYRPRWFMEPVHINPEEAVKAHHALRAQTSVPMHFGTFALGDDGEMEPVRDLQRAIAANGDPRFWILEHGEGREVPPCD